MNTEDQFRKIYYARMPKLFSMALICISLFVGVIYSWGYEFVFMAMLFSLMIALCASVETYWQTSWALSCAEYAGLAIIAITVVGTFFVIYTWTLPVEIAQTAVAIAGPLFLAIAAAYIITNFTFIKEKTYC